MNKKQLYSLSEIKRMTSNEIRELDITRIVATSNFDREDYSESDLLTNIPYHVFKSVASAIDENHNNENYSTYYKAATSDYKLSVFEP